MERLGKPRHGREDRRLSEREVSEIKSRMELMGIAAGSFNCSRVCGIRSGRDRSPYFAEASALFSRALRRLAAFR
jgi:hypothetical protein